CTGDERQGPVHQTTPEPANPAAAHGSTLLLLREQDKMCVGVKKQDNVKSHRRSAKVHREPNPSTTIQRSDVGACRLGSKYKQTALVVCVPSQTSPEYGLDRTDRGSGRGKCRLQKL
ncbi:hypothetical protein BaRGS_00012868, partial [Batillaria attramentaria]